MADFNALEALINAHIKKNGVQAITGNILNGILRGMVSALGKGYTIAGSASPATDPGTMTGPLAYIAYTAGTYTHFGGLEVEQGEVAMLIYNEAEWHKEVLFSLSATATIDGNVGTPEVGVSFVDGLLTFDFRNMKGNPGNDGDAAGFGTISATVDGNIGTPGVSVQSSGPDTAKNITFQFTNLKGETGVTSVVATVDNTVGTPTCTVSLVGQQLTLAFSGLKGAQGDTGSSVDYPFTIVNNLTTNDATQALSAAMGVELAGQVSQLDLKVTDFMLQICGDSLGAEDYVGYYCNNYFNGNVLPSDASSDGYLIRVDSGDKITIESTELKSGKNSFVFYNGVPSTSTFVQRYEYESGVMVVPSGATYLLISIDPSANGNTFVSGYDTISKDAIPVLLYDLVNGGNQKLSIKTTGLDLGASDYVGYYCNNYFTGAVLPADSSSNGYLISVNAGDELSIVSTELKNGKFSYEFYNGTPSTDTFIQRVEYVSGKMTVPSGAKYLLISINPSLSGNTKITGINTIASECLPASLYNEIDGLAAKTIGKLFSSADYVGYYCYNYFTGAILPSDSISNAYLLSVSAGEKLVIECTERKNGDNSFEFYNGTPSTETFVQRATYSSGIMTVPSGAKYLLISINPSVSGTTFVKAYQSISMWSGKKMLAIGDSMTENNIYQRWQDYAGQLLDMDVTTHAKGGIGVISMVDGDGAGFPALTTDDVADKDLVILMGLYNERDYARNNPGTISDMYPTQNSFLGRLNYAIDKIFTLLTTAGNLSCRVVLVGAHKYGKNSYTDRDSYTDENKISSLAKLVADEQSLHFVNLNNDAGINKYNWDVFSASTTSYNPNYIPADGINDGTNKPFASLSVAPPASDNNGKYITITDESGCYLSNGTSWVANSAAAIWNADQFHLGDNGFRRVGGIVAGEINNIWAK